MDQSLNLASLGILLFILLVIFLFCREIICWYFKLNKSVELMEQILVELKKIILRIKNGVLAN